MRRTWRVLLALTMLIAAGCGDDDDDGDDDAADSGTSVEIASPSNGTTVKGNVVTLDLEATGIQIVKADGNTSGDTGHFHVFIDKVPVAAGATIDVAPGIVHSTDDPLKVTGLNAGKHTLTVVLGNGVHQRIGTAEDSVEVTVEGPTVDATAPATATAGQPISVEAVVEGVQLVKADGDTSGKTGHLHAFIDKEPVAGQAIPLDDPLIIHSATSPISLPALNGGAHTIWIVVGNGNHVAFDPLVADKLTVTVS